MAATRRGPAPSYDERPVPFMNGDQTQMLVENGDGASRRWRPLALLAVCLAVLGAGGAFYVLSGRMSEPSRAAAAAPARRAAVRVSVDTAVRRDLPVYVTG